MVSKWCWIIYHKDIINHKDELKGGQYTNLILAALFHDMNHSMGSLKDDQNVKNAIKSMESWLDQEKGLSTDVDKNVITEIIKATEYPYVIDKDKLSYSQKIIRDADLLVSNESNWMDSILFGLQSEMKVDNIDDLIEGNIKFHESIEMLTDFGKKVQKEGWLPLERLKSLKSILDN